jgi:hypothetical protein
MQRGVPMRNLGAGEQAQLAAQHHKLGTHRPDRRAAVLAKVGDRLEVGRELAPVRNLPGVDRIREQPIEMSAREGCAAALRAIRRCAAFCSEPEAIGFFLDPAHAPKLTIQSEDAAHGRGLGRVDDEVKNDGD